MRKRPTAIAGSHGGCTGKTAARKWKRVLRVMRERGLLIRPRRLRARRKKEWGRVEAARPNQIWQSDMTKVWAGANVGWDLSGGGDRLLHAGDRGLGLVAPLPNGRRSFSGSRAGGIEPLACGEPRSKLDADHRQRNAIYFDALHANTFSAGHQRIGGRRITIRKEIATSNGSIAA